jgi:hypothetical protein
MDLDLLLLQIQPGQILFGLALIFFGSAFTLSFFIDSKTHVVHALTGVLFLILFLLLGVVAIEFSSAATPSYTYGSFSSLSEALSTHRWLLFQLPIILTVTSLIILSVYKDAIAKPHARMYKATVMISIAVSFASLLLIGFESLI